MLPTRVLGLFIVIFRPSSSTAVNSSSEDADQSHCNRYTPNKTDGLRFTEPTGPATLAIGCANHLVELVCCASDFKTITWYHTTDSGATWTQFETDNGTRNLYERNQVASIFRVDFWADRGSYKCVAEGFRSGERIENTVYLEIRNCSSWSGKPVWLNPRQEVTTQEVNVGDDVVIPCKTFSGTSCVEDFVCNSFWYKHPNTSIPKNNLSAHVYYNYICRARTLEMETILTIKGVTEEDFGKYNCTAINSNDHRARDRLVILKKKDPANVVVLINVAIAGGVLLTVAVVIILVTFQRRSDLDFKIWKATRELGDEQLSVFLINAGVDQRFAKHLKDILKTKLQFAVSSSFEDVLGNEASISRIPALAEKCSCVLVLLTPALLEDEALLADIREIIHRVTPVFVTNGIDRINASSSPSGGHGPGQNLTVALAVSRPLRWPGVTGDAGPGGGAVEDWERRRATKRQANVFWKELQLSLLKQIPRQEHGRNGKRRVRIDSTEPLLQRA